MNELMADKPFRSKLERAERKLVGSTGEDNLIGVRDDIEEIWVKNRKDKPREINSAQVAREVNQALEQPRRNLRTFEDILSKLTILDGVTGGGLAVLMYWMMKSLGFTSVPSVVPSIIIFILFTSLNHGILYTKAFMNHMCYKDASPREEDTRLAFKRGWNKGVLMSGSAVLGVFIGAILRGNKGYELGMAVLEELDRIRNS